MEKGNILKKYDNRRKLQLLLWAILPLFLICYLLAFKKTFALVKTYNQNVQLALRDDTTLDSLTVYSVKLKNITAWKKQYMMDTNVMDANIIATLNINCKNLGLQFKEYKPLNTNAQNIWTRAITVKGSYAATLHLLYQLEQIERICRIASISFNKQKAANGGEELNSTFYIQNLIKK